MSMVLLGKNMVTENGANNNFKKQNTMNTQNITAAKNSIAYKVAMDLVNNTSKSNMVYGDIIRPCYTSGSGRFTSNQDHTTIICKTLTEMGLSYTTGNDSPRGGKTGNFIKIIKN